LRTVMPATALAGLVLLVAPACGGTLEGKYRRGELTSSTTTAPRPPATSPNGTAPGAPASSTTTSTAVPTSGNAARRTGRGEPRGGEPDGTIVVNRAVWRAVDEPLGGRHR
jgi:hypothetical protein